MRVNRFQRSTNKHLDLFGGSLTRRMLESHERKAKSVMNRSSSETRFSKRGHLMPKPDTLKMIRSNSFSPNRIREQERESGQDHN